MPITAPPDIPLITDPATFATRAQAWTFWQAEQLYPEIVNQSSLLGLSLSATSVTSNTVGTGSKTFTVETGKGFVEGVSLSIADANTPTNRMFAVVTSYNSGTGELIVTSQAFEGSGTYTDWQIAPAFNGVISSAQIENNAVTEDKIEDTALSYFKSQKLNDIDATVAANALTITVNSGVYDFRSTTLTDGTPTRVTISSPITVTVPNGGTLGTANGILARLAIILLNNAGTGEAAIANANGGLVLNEDTLISTTAVGTGSDSDSIVYSTTGRSNVAYRVIGYIEITEATAGTWATAPTLVQPLGARSDLSRIYNSDVKTASGTSVDFTGIPNWVKRITVLLNSFSSNGTSNFLIQIGDAGGIENTGYESSSANISGAPTTSTSTAGFLFSDVILAANTYGGQIILSRQNVNTNSWNCSGFINATTIQINNGTKSLSAPLTQLRITTVGGVNTFDSGTIQLLME